MKKCPQCGREYDNTMSFCLDDGSELLYGPASSGSPEASTAVLPNFEPPTRIFASDPNAMTVSMSSYQPNSIAVLPFTHLSKDDDDEYFCDGLAEELINALSRVDDLKVVGRTSSFSFKNKSVDLAQIGSVLGVNSVVGGSVRKFGDRMRINVSLTSTMDGFNIWSDKYDTEMRDLFDVQDEITRSVVTSLKEKLLDRPTNDDDRMTSLIEDLKHHANDVEAYQLYLRGRFFLNKFTPDGFLEAQGCFERAIEIDPNYAIAYAGLADTHVMLTELGPVPPHDAMPKAKLAALKAIELDPELSEGYSSLALILQDYEYNLAAAETAYLRAIELNSGRASVHQTYGLYLAQMGRHEEARAEFKKTLSLDPLSVIGNCLYGFGMFLARRYDECLDQSHKTLELDANFPAAYLSISFANHMKGNYAEAVEAYARYSDILGEIVTARRARAAYASGGWTAYLKLMAAPDGPASRSAYITAIAQAALTENDLAIESLERSFEQREPHIIMVKVDPRLDATIRQNPRFQSLLGKIGFLIDTAI